MTSVAGDMVIRDEASKQIVLRNNDYNHKPDGKGYSFLVRATQPIHNDILSDLLNLDHSINILKPLEETVIDTFFIAGQVTPALNLTCLE